MKKLLAALLLCLIVTGDVNSQVITVTRKSNNTTITSSTGSQKFDGYVEELIVLSTVGTTTDSIANLLPANSFIVAVTARVVTSITPGAIDWSIGDATTAGRFINLQTGLIAGSNTVGFGALTNGPVQIAAAKLRITTTGTPAVGSIRVVVFYTQYTPPQS